MTLIRKGIVEYERDMLGEGFDLDDDIEPRECLEALGVLLEEHLERIEANAEGSTL